MNAPSLSRLPRRLLIATTNRKKKEELAALLKGLAIEILTLDDLAYVPRVHEDQDTFEGNAVKKAVTISRRTGEVTLADDSGLEVEALGGSPGVYSARFAGRAKSDEANIRKLLRLLDGMPREKRKARFVCALALARDGKVERVFTGKVSGYIGREKRGTGGFGYDPVFYYPPFKMTFAQIEQKRKNSISHRSRALRKLAGSFRKER
ncbi:MAG: XTP/dITP diphosphatase [Candidatus Omnitrophota bacterium]